MNELDGDPIARIAAKAMAAFARSTASPDDAAPFAKYAADPCGFFREVLGLEPWARHAGLPAREASQVDVLEAVRDHNLVAVRSGHKTGKSASAAGLALWWCMTRTRARVILTAPSAHQVQGICWQEIRLLHSGQHPAQHGKRLPQLPGRCNVDAHNGLELAPGWGIIGLTTDTPERMSGKSGDRIMFLVDEASGYPEPIFTSIMGNLAGGGKLILFSNPTRTSGTFFEAFHERRELWKTLHVSSTSTPNFHGASVPGLAAPTWLKIAADMWGGPGSPLYDVRVLGDFPTQGSMSVVSLAHVEAAHARWADMPTPEDAPLDIGLDVAREGDDESILAPRRGRKLLELEAVPIDHSPGSLPPGPQVGEAAVRMARRLVKPEDEFRPRVLVDCIGVGSAVVDYLVMNYATELEVVAVNSASSADRSLVIVPRTDSAPAKMACEEYRNLRAQMAFGLATWLRDGAIPPDPKLDAELVAPTFSYRERGRIQVEEKAQIKKRLKRSPDRADALALAVYEPPEPDAPNEVTATLIG